MVVRSLLFACLMSLAVGAHAGDPMEEVISFSYQDKDFESILLELSDMLDFDFAYNPNLVDQDQKFSGSYDSVRAGDVVDQLCREAGLKSQFANGVLKLREESKSKKKLANSDISGQVAFGDQAHGQSASISEPGLDLYSQTDTSGAYKLYLNVPEYPLKIRVSSEGYQDKTIQFNPRHQKSFYVKLMPDTIPEEEKKRPLYRIDSIGGGVDTATIQEITDFFPGNFMVPKEMVTIARSSEFIREQDVQGQLVAGSGTNAKEAGLYENNFSFNLISGYTAGVKGIELGFFNFNRFNMSGFQAGLFGNSVGGVVQGFQTAVLYNHSMLGVNGVQVGGLYNESRYFVRGLQGALANRNTGKLMGAQLGVFNLQQGVGYGLQAAVFNLTLSDFYGLQAGVLNLSEEVNGAQVGVGNYTPKIEGAQIGTVNIAGKNNGFQLGIVNIADTVHGGYFGLINIFRKGHISLEASGNETRFADLQLRSGTRGFYTILSGGIPWDTLDNSWRAGGGFGRISSIAQPIGIQTELVYHFVDEGYNSHMLNFNLALYLELFRSISISFGPTISLHATNDIPDSFYDAIKHPYFNGNPLDHNGYIISEENIDDWYLQSWLGFRFGLGYVF